MNQIQTKQCLHCNQSKEGLTFKSRLVDSQPPQFTTKHHCWSDLESLLRKTLEECEDWERNKKKLLSTCIEKCRKKESFANPWKIRKSDTHFYEGGKRCPDCCHSLSLSKFNAYGDNNHVCVRCKNCNEKIDNHMGRNNHIAWYLNRAYYQCRGRKNFTPQNKPLPIDKREKEQNVKKSSTVKNCLIVSALIILVGGGIWIVKKFLNSKKF